MARHVPGRPSRCVWEPALVSSAATVRCSGFRLQHGLPSTVQRLPLVLPDRKPPNSETSPVQEEGEEPLLKVPSSITKLRHKKENAQQ